jgi:eukaryotic-like serine/threonine-protein kinase
VKPANVLLGPEGRVVLTGFGIAKAADSPALTNSGVLLGSPSYLAPECARGGRAGPAADLWALGASLFAAVEGRPPFERDGVLASLTAVVADELEPPTHASPLLPVIEGLLCKDPDRRLDLAAAEQMLQRIVAEGDLGSAVIVPGDSASPETTAVPPEAAGEGKTQSHGAFARDQATDGAVISPEHLAPERPEAGFRYRPARPGGRPAGRPSSPGHSRRFRMGLAALTTVVASAVIAAGIVVVSGLTSGHRPAPVARPRTSSAVSQPIAVRGTPHPSASSAAVPSTPSARSTATPGSGELATLPAGYYRFANSTGFSIGVPRGWQISHVGHYVYITDPANSGIFLLIDQSHRPKANSLADWQQQAANRQATYPDYHLILLRAVRYTQAEKAADWEFTYDRNGVMVQILNRNVLANAHHAYALYWSTPASDWNAYYHYFQVFAATFRPAS